MGYSPQQQTLPFIDDMEEEIISQGETLQNVMRRNEELIRRISDDPEICARAADLLDSRLAESSTGLFDGLTLSNLFSDDYDGGGFYRDSMNLYNDRKQVDLLLLNVVLRRSAETHGHRHKS